MKTLKLTEKEIAQVITGEVMTGSLKHYWEEYEHSDTEYMHQHLNINDEITSDLFNRARDTAKSIVEQLFCMEKGKTQRVLNRIDKIKRVFIYTDKEVFKIQIDPYSVNLSFFCDDDDKVSKHPEEFLEESKEVSQEG